MGPAVPLALAAATSMAAAALVAPGREPKGKGVFIRSVRHCGSPQKCGEYVKRMGFKWVAILLAWQKPNGRSTVYLNRELAAYARAFRKAGAKVWLWAWPEPGQSWELVDLYMKAKRLGVGPVGFIVDPEGPYYGRRFESAAARDLLSWKLLAVPLGVTTYGGGPAHHPSFAWDVWSQTDFGIPQIYDSKHRLGADYPRFAIKQWAAAGWTRIVPAWGASDKHSPNDMRWHIQQTPPIYRAACWWDLYWLIRSNKRSAVIENMRMPKREKLARVA